MDTLIGMRLFEQVVRGESFSEAGRQLGLAPSSVSRQINALEDGLGVRLFNRSTRNLKLTEAGQLYHERVARILADIDEANRAVVELEAEPRGTLRVNAPLVFGRVHVAPLIPDFLARYPEVQMDFTTTDQVIDLVEEGADVAIRIGELKDSSLVARKLAPLRRVICGSPTYLAAHGTPERPEDLTGHNCLTFRFHAASSLWRPGSDLWRMKGAEGVVEVAVSGRLRANGVDVLLDAARAGLGLVLMPIWMVGDDIRGGRLRPVLSQYRVSPTTIDAAIYAVFPASRHLSPKVRVFIDYLAERFRDIPYLTDEVPVPPRARSRGRKTAAGIDLRGAAAPR